MFSNEMYIFSLIELLDIYELYLEPFLGDHNNYIDKELTIMGEVAFIADWEINPHQPTLTKLIDTILIPSDILDNFLAKFNRSVTFLLNNINDNVEYIRLAKTSPPRRFKAHIEIYTGYIVVLSASTYKI